MCAAAYDSDVGGLSFTLQANDRTTAPGAFLQLRLACVALDVEFEFIVGASKSTSTAKPGPKANFAGVCFSSWIRITQRSKRFAAW